MLEWLLMVTQNKVQMSQLIEYIQITISGP